MDAILNSKKGQVTTIAPTIIVLIVAATILILGIVVVQSIRDTDIISKAVGGTVTGETLTTVTETGELLAHSTDPAFVFTITTLTNTTGFVIPTDNFTAGTDGRISFIGDTEFNNTDWNASYTFSAGDLVFTDTNKTLTGLGTFGDFWEIIVLAIIISLVIGLLLTVFGTSRNR